MHVADADGMGFFSVPTRLYTLYFLKEKKGKGKGSTCVLQNDSKWEGSAWHSKISHQINTAHMGPPKPKGLYLLKFMNEKKG